MRHLEPVVPSAALESCIFNDLISQKWHHWFRFIPEPTGATRPEHLIRGQVALAVH